MSVIVCGPSSSLNRRRILHCPVCEQRRRHVVNYGGYWGMTITCCGCGDAWQDGERLERPFSPGWRKRAIQSAKERYQSARSGPPPTMCEMGACPESCPECQWGVA